MLPHPDFIFTIPSIHDDANLECHIYHPRANCSRPQESIQKRGAVFAHPYAPLGGCFDDPVVASVGSELLKAGFVLGTFNFRFVCRHSGAALLLSNESNLAELELLKARQAGPPGRNYLITFRLPDSLLYMCST